MFEKEDFSALMSLLFIWGKLSESLMMFGHQFNAALNYQICAPELTRVNRN